LAKTKAEKALGALKAYCLPNDTKWPTQRELDEVDSALHKLAHLYGRRPTGKRRRRTSEWQNVVKVQKNLPGLNARKIVTSLIDRAAARIQEAGTPEIERILALSKKKTEAGSLASRFLESLRRSNRSPASRNDIKWNDFIQVLFPPGSLGFAKDCRARAAEIELEWLRYNDKIFGPSLDLTDWIGSLGFPISEFPKHWSVFTDSALRFQRRSAQWKARSRNKSTERVARWRKRRTFLAT
jgi:hypothetical protein